ncbi:MAG TPA: nucleoside triphosphate pyrophosphohydrolase [Pseudolysinimonas sp.]|nr:nucleoside triphosphate pyrophosphohydrolase [Pseudolysinimonas sp.]
MADLVDSGGKAAGLLRLDPAWYPPTLVIPPAVHERFRSEEIGEGFFVDVDSEADLLHMLQVGTKSTKVLVRSNAKIETLSERGQFESFAVEYDAADVERTMVTGWHHVETNVALGYLLQPEIAGLASGHLSNEHRVSRDATVWRIEHEGWRTDKRPGRWRVTTSTPADPGPLLCATTRLLEVMLRRVARWFSDLGSRYHLEWVWDGDRIWIVQADIVPRTLGPAPGDAWEPTVGIEVDAESLSAWRELNLSKPNPSLDGWPKAAALQDFALAKLPLAQLWRLQDAALMDQLLQDDVDPGLLSDLELICSGHVVIRTDVRGETLDVMLPKTGTIADPIVVASWLKSTVRLLAESGVSTADMSFLAHRFLRARASAWTLASPGQAYVEVDSMWGTPDGLAWLPHDSAWVHVGTGEVRRSIEGKTSFLDIDEAEEWTYRETPTEWIWRASMTEDQLRTVAAGSRRLADALNKPVLTMWFVDLLGRRSAECLPWVLMDPPPESSESERLDVSPQSERVEIRSGPDLDEYRSAVHEGRPRVLRLVPGPDLVRDKGFVSRVAEVAKETGSTVELVGSALAHPYYMLLREGVTVACIGRFDPPEVQYNKLVRDAIVDQIADNGERVVSYFASGPEYTRLLRLKTVEEALELFRAGEKEDATAEMADLQEVLDTLRRALGITRDEVRTAQAVKRRRRGAFREGSVLVRTGGSAATSAASRGAIPLFDDDPTWSRSWQVQQHGDRILLSCVPPLDNEPHNFHLKTSTDVIAIEYANNQIEVRVAPRDHIEFDTENLLF